MVFSIIFPLTGQEWSEGDVMASKRKQEDSEEPVDDSKYLPKIVYGNMVLTSR